MTDKKDNLPLQTGKRWKWYEVKNVNGVKTVILHVKWDNLQNKLRHPKEQE